MTAAGSTIRARTPIDPAAEEAKVKALTGSSDVVIARGKSGGIKLPGL